jgi:hypothetical protein
VLSKARRQIQGGKCQHKSSHIPRFLHILGAFDHGGSKYVFGESFKLPFAGSSNSSSSLCDCFAISRNAEILGGVVCTVVMATRPLNTTLAYDPKAKEYDTFCGHVYHDYQPSTRYTVGTEKVFLFLFYQAFRNKYKHGGLAKGVPHGFSSTDYNTMVVEWARYKSCLESGKIDDIPDPSNPCTTVKHCKKQFGRSMRHKDVWRCSIGAFALYLLFCFHKSGEMDDGIRPNFANNKEWYDIKILTDATQKNRTRCCRRELTPNRSERSSRGFTLLLLILDIGGVSPGLSSWNLRRFHRSILEF